MRKTEIMGTIAAITVGVALSAFAIYGLETSDRKYKEKESLSPLVREVVSISAGEDRVWQTSEKRKILDEFGFQRETIGDNQDIYFRPYATEDQGSWNKIKIDSGFEVVVGYNLENNGWLLIGSSAKSGTLIGRVQKKSLLDYIHNKPSP